MTVSTRQTPVHTSKAPPILDIHHMAFRCFDAEETSRFYQDVVGLKLAAALAFDEISGTGVTLKYMHLFFEMGDGNLVAFFDVPDHLRPSLFRPKSPLNLHIALQVATEEEMMAFLERFEGHGLEVEGPIDHGFVKSIFTYDPNGIGLEITCKTPDYAAIMGAKSQSAERDIKIWTEQTKVQKEEYLKQQSS